MTVGTSWLNVLTSVDTPVLPASWVMNLSLRVSWAVVLAWVGTRIASNCRASTRTAIAWTLAISAWLPSPFSLTYWLGLAFQAPSIAATLICGWSLCYSLVAEKKVRRESQNAGRGPALFMAVAGVLLGYMLLLDTMAILPLQLYSLGFSPLALLLTLSLSLLPFVAARHQSGHELAGATLLPLALLLFAVARLPSGNVWDAVLDPWLWVALHVHLFKVARRSLFKTQS